MTIQYELTGGKIQFSKAAFALEMLLPDSPLKKIIKAEEKKGNKHPAIEKSETTVVINYNDATDILLDENFTEIFKKLKAKHKDKMKGSVVIRITALTSYHMILGFDREDGTVSY